MSEHGLDLEICERQPIHAPQAVQWGGRVWAFAGPSLEPVAASEGAGDVPDLGDAGWNACRVLAAGANGADLAHFPSLNGAWDLRAHRSEGLLLLEAEPREGDSPTAAETRHWTTAVLSGVDDNVVMESLAQGVRALTGFDRVMTYRFDLDGTGIVEAEASREPSPRYLGLRFPASDIPESARILYRVQAVRMIPDVAAAAVPMPGSNPLTGGPIDLSPCLWRAVSPMHLEYLANMGVAASCSFALFVDGNLWGLVACHHGTSYRPSADARSAARLLTEVAGQALARLATESRVAHRAQVEALRTAWLQESARGQDLLDAVASHDSNLRELFHADGWALTIGGQRAAGGELPGPEAVASYVETPERIHATDAEGPAAFPGRLRLSLGGDDALVLYRRDWVREVRWAGDPGTPALPSTVDQWLHPRRSFAEWVQRVEGRSAPWSPDDFEAARLVREALLDLLTARADFLRRRNVALTLENAELSAFANLAAHDVKEPLRVIETFAGLLREDPSDPVLLEGIQDSTRRLRALIDDLITLARVGGEPLAIAPVALDDIVDDALGDLRPTLEAAATIIDRTPLPVVRADARQVRRLVANLLSNAVKYSQRVPAPRVEIEPAPPRRGMAGFTVRDNGPGFPPELGLKLFEPFFRDARTAAFEGTGLGLAICRQVVERAGGEIVAESDGDGATFTVWLPSPEGQA